MDGENVVLDVPFVPIIDGWEIQKADTQYKN